MKTKYQAEIEEDVEKYQKKLPRRDRDNIRNKIDCLEENTRPHGYIKLHGYKIETYKSMSTIEKMCDRAYLLARGQLQAAPSRTASTGVKAELAGAGSFGDERTLG
jgi:hypothetical protein